MQECSVRGRLKKKSGFQMFNKRKVLQWEPGAPGGPRWGSDTCSKKRKKQRIGGSKGRRTDDRREEALTNLTSSTSSTTSSLSSLSLSSNSCWSLQGGSKVRGGAKEREEEARDEERKEGRKNGGRMVRGRAALKSLPVIKLFLQTSSFSSNWLIKNSVWRNSRWKLVRSVGN